MDGANLVRMANRIGEFFAAMPEGADEGIAEHIARFWEPRMRRQVYALLDGPLGAELQPLVARSLRAHREVLLPALLDPLPIPPQGESEA